MCSRLPACSLSLLLFLVGSQLVSSSEGPLLPSITGFQPPEMDGSAVDISCRIPSVTTPSTTTTTSSTTATTTMTTTTTVTTTTTTTTTTTKAAQVTAKPKKTVDQSPARKSTYQKSGRPIRKQTAFRGPIIDNRFTFASNLLQYLLANSRQPLANTHPRLPVYWPLPDNRLISQPIRSVPHRIKETASWSKEIFRSYRMFAESLSSEEE